MPTPLQLSLREFIGDLKRLEIFIKLEADIKNPISLRSRPKSETLLPAYVSLCCGRFERFLQQSFFHAADDLRARISLSNDPRIIKVDTFHWENINGFLKWAVTVKGIERSDLITKVQTFSTAISAGLIFPESFQYTYASPNSETLKKMFGRFGIEDAFRKLAVAYLDSRGRRFNPELIDSTLSAFVKRRHEAAHYGRIARMTRADAQDDHVFITALATAVNSVLTAHLTQIR